MSKKIKFFSLIIVFSIFFSSYLLKSKTDQVLNIYSGRKLDLIKPLISEFENSYKIKINIVTGKSDAFIEKLKIEKKNTPADILLTTDVGRLQRAKDNDLFLKVNSKILKKNIKKEYRSIDNDWFGFSIRARPIIYSNERVKKSDLSTYEDLASNKWFKKICMRSSNNVYNQSFIAWMIINNGQKRTSEWLASIVNNFARKPYGGDRDQIRSIASGECDITIANTYYLANMLDSKKESDRLAANKVSVFWPNQNSTGTHINISGAGIIKNSKNVDNAIKFLEFLSTIKAQKIYTKEINEYSIRNDIPPSKTINNWGDFKKDTSNINRIGLEIKNSIYLATKNKWR